MTPDPATYTQLLDAFAALFRGRPYIHRNQTLGNFVAAHLFEDLVALGRSTLLHQRAATKSRVLNLDVPVVGRPGRRGDAVFGEIVPGIAALDRDGFVVGRGPVATTEIGAETKVLAKSMIKQIDRVMNDLRRQAEVFRQAGGNPICVALVGVNHSPRYVGFEGEREYPTTGRGGAPHPSQEAEKAIQRLLDNAAAAFDEFQILRYSATNQVPFPFEWVDFEATRTQYAALLTRVSAEYDRRFA